MSKILFFIFLSIFSNSFLLEECDNSITNPPVLRLTINPDNLGAIEKYAIEKLLAEREFTIDPITVSEDVDFLGKLDLTLNNIIIKITNMTDAEIYLSFVETKNINFILNILNGEITFDYELKTGLISGKGNSTLYINNISLSLNNTLIQIPNEHEPEKLGPGLKIKGVSFNDLDMNMTFSKNGTLEKLLKYLNKNLKTILLKIGENEINKKEALRKINDMLYDLFKSISLNIPIDNLLQTNDNVNISFSMNEEPIIKNNVLELSLEAEVKSDNFKYNETNNIILPHIINSYNLFTEKTLNGVVSQFILNNVLDILSFFGKLNFEINNDTIGLEQLNVGTLSLIIRELTNVYKAALQGKIITDAIDGPILKINDKNKLNIKLFENLKFIVFNDTQYFNEDIGDIAVDADSTIEIEATFYFNDTDIQLTLDSIIMLTFEVRNSLVGDINTARVISNFQTIVKSLFLGSINNNIKQKIQELTKPFSFENINLSELVVQSYENYFKFDLSPTLKNLTKLFI